jgi:sulfur oxygenase/reductase
LGGKETDMKPGIAVAINKSKVVNDANSMRLMMEVGPRVCITTASHPGFLGYENSLQIGVLPLAGRYGGAKIHMEKELNPIAMFQYTFWKTWQDHEDFHQKEFDRIFELCGHCLSMVVEGPWEPIYEIVAAKMPIPTPEDRAAIRSLMSPERVVVVGEHSVKGGKEREFEKGVPQVLDMISQSPGFLGYMLLKEVGASAIGSFQLTPGALMEALQTLGANPPKSKKGNFLPLEAASKPAEYIVHTEWESPELAHGGLAKVLVNHEIREAHNEKVLAHVIRGPYIMFFRPMMEDPNWRRHLA